MGIFGWRIQVAMSSSSAGATPLHKTAVPISIHTLDISFPFNPYDCQRDYMDKVIQALDTCTDAALESPTGTGKTLSLLCAALAWLQRAKATTKPTLQQVAAGPRVTLPSQIVPRIFYCSRTHSQLGQVVRELNKTIYRDVRVCTMGSRDQLCVHETVSKEKDNALKAVKCRNLVSKRQCHYYNQWNAVDMATLDALYSQSGKVLDIEDLTKTAKMKKHCPFYRSRQQQETAELVLLPYNYLIDPHLRQTHKIDLRNNIVIFDEAHNLEGVCEESMSVTLSTQDVAFVEGEIKYALEKLLERNESIRADMDESTLAFGAGMSKDKEKKKEINMAEAANLLQSVQDLLSAMDDTYESGKGKEVYNQPGKVFDGGTMIEMLQKAAFRRENAVTYSGTLHDLASFAEEVEDSDTRVSIRDRGRKMLEFGAFLCRVFADSFEAVERKGVTDKEVAGENFKLHAVKEGTKISFNYMCLSAGMAMRLLKSRGVVSIIVTSGTLAPLDQFCSNLGIPFLHRLQNMHAAKGDQVSLIRIPRNDGALLDGCFKNRDSESYLMGMGHGVATTVENVPQGVLVFFPSYKSMESCIDKWKEPPKGKGESLWVQMARRKELVVEPRKKTELAEARFRFENGIATRGGAVFFAVTRGKVSEGIDFADAHSRAVVIIGIPYPPLFDIRVVLKKEYLSQRHAKDKKLMSGDSWYATEGYRAVNQAIGRVLRNVNDFGIVVLLDSRFNRSLASFFPKWVQHSFVDVPDVKASGSVMRKFFDKFGVQVKSSREALSRPLNGSSEVEIRQRKRPPTSSPFAPMQPTIESLSSVYSAPPVAVERETVAVAHSLVSIVEAPRRPLPRIFPQLDPALHARPLPSSSTTTQPPPKKRLLTKENGRLGETTQEKEKATMPSDQKKKMMDNFKTQIRGAGLWPRVHECLSQFRGAKTTEGEMVKGMAEILLPAHAQLFKDVVVVIPSAAAAIDRECRRRGIQ